MQTSLAQLTVSISRTNGCDDLDELEGLGEGCGSCKHLSKCELIWLIFTLLKQLKHSTISLATTTKSN